MPHFCEVCDRRLSRARNDSWTLSASTRASASAIDFARPIVSLTRKPPPISSASAHVASNGCFAVVDEFDSARPGSAGAGLPAIGDARRASVEQRRAMPSYSRRIASQQRVAARPARRPSQNAGGGFDRRASAPEPSDVDADAARDARRASPVTLRMAQDAGDLAIARASRSLGHCRLVATPASSSAARTASATQNGTSHRRSASTGCGAGSCVKSSEVPAAATQVGPCARRRESDIRRRSCGRRSGRRRAAPRRRRSCSRSPRRTKSTGSGESPPASPRIRPYGSSARLSHAA